MHRVHMCCGHTHCRCLRSAERCPDEKWQTTMQQYVRGRFRDAGSDAIPIRLSLGEAELVEMESYHNAREVYTFFWLCVDVQYQRGLHLFLVVCGWVVGWVWMGGGRLTRGLR